MRTNAGAVLGAPAQRRTWAEVVYAAVTLPPAAAGFVFVSISLVVGVALSVTFVGLPILAAGGLGARGFGTVHRRLAAALLDEHIAVPPAFAGGSGVLGWIQSALRDGPGWRARAYLVVKLPLAVLTAMAVVGWASSPVVLALQLSGGRLGAAATSVVALFAGPWVVRALVGVDRRLVRTLLGRPRTTELEEARARIADDAAATLRRIERDLHDGTQAQLGALAMKLGQAKEKLEHRDGVPFDPAGALALVEDTHRHAKEALVELRDIVRGIHPPALDLGLDAALQTLVARSPVPATLHVELSRRPSEAIETMAYFSVAELLANAVRHGRCTHVDVDLTERRGRLRLRVVDDGIGGATPGGGTGLTGLADRVRGVDGRVEVASPPGGPTVVTVDLPLHA